MPDHRIQDEEFEDNVGQEDWNLNVLKFMLTDSPWPCVERSRDQGNSDERPLAARPELHHCSASSRSFGTPPTDRSERSSSTTDHASAVPSE